MLSAVVTECTGGGSGTAKATLAPPRAATSANSSAGANRGSSATAARAPCTGLPSLK